MGLMCSVGRVRPAHARYKDLNVFNARSRATHVRGHVRGVWFAMYRSRVEHVFRVHRHFRFDRLSHFSCTWALPDAPKAHAATTHLCASPRGGDWCVVSLCSVSGQQTHLLGTNDGTMS